MTNNRSSELIEIMKSQEQERVDFWQPIVGGETLELLGQYMIPELEKNQVRDEAVSILSKCVSPHEAHETTTGLVVGYVQSGKTMSFTTVTALARDNGYQMVIIITGTSIPLLNQSTERLKSDLRLLTRRDRKWQHFESRALKRSDYGNIRNTLADWNDPLVPQSEKKTVLITVMKHHGHLHKVSRMLAELGNLQGVPVLIIDDEADQASLNTKVNNGEVSTTYQRILTLRHHLPHHSFLQYTATPQAPLLINLIDVLSPRFAEVLTPGADYVGGKEFFLESPNLILTIPDREIPTKNSQFDAPPKSLLYALRLFFLGVVAGLVLENGEGNRSMMVHPSRRTVGHSEYFRWIERIRKRWQDTLSLDQDNIYRKELLEDFEVAYQSLKTTVSDLPPFNDVCERLLYAIRSTNLEEINAARGRTPTVNWRNSYAHILVGGQAMDRGFTVEGLTVTYMPRGGGVGNADTIQQRARFLGYKKSYQNYCRIFLENQVRDAYRHYVAHEEDIRDRLIEHNSTGQPLTDWKRAFFLNIRLKPTRKNVLDLDYMRGSFENQWYAPRAPHDSLEAARQNNHLIYGDFLNSLPLIVDERYLGQGHQTLTSFSLDTAYSQLLVPFRVTRSVDSQRYTGLLLQLKAHLESCPDSSCVLYLMSGGSPRRRKANEKKDEIKQLFQGRSPKVGKIVYPGDREIKEPHQITIQIHNLTIESQGNVYENIPAIAVWVPRNLSRDWLVQ